MRRPRRALNQINVVPYIDVMLVLLVIFMITAPLVTPGTIDLPQVGKAAVTPDQPLEVDVHKDGTLSVIDRTAGASETHLAKADLLPWIRARQVLHPDQPVVIAGDKAVRYEWVLDVMDVLQRAQVHRIGLLARAKAG